MGCVGYTQWTSAEDWNGPKRFAVDGHLTESLPWNIQRLIVFCPMSVYPYLFISFSLFVCLSVCLCLFVCLSVCQSLFVCVPVYLSICLPTYLSICLLTYLP